MVKIYAADPDRQLASTDITEGVQALYDLAIHSMDYGSGFWSYEDAAPVAKLATLMGWDGADGLQQYADDQLHKTEASAWARDNGHLTYESWYESFMIRQEYADGSVVAYPSWRLKQHEHVFSTVGRCMWHQCTEKEQR